MRLARGLLAFLTIVVGPFAVIASALLYQLAGEAESVMVAIAEELVSSPEGRANLAEDMLAEILETNPSALDELQAAGYADPRSALLEGAATLFATETFAATFVAHASELGREIDSGVIPHGELNFGPALLEAEGVLDPNIHRVLASSPVVTIGAYGSLPSSTTFKVHAMAIMLIAAVVFANTYGARKSARTLLIANVLVGVYSGLLFWLVSAATNSADQDAALLGKVFGQIVTPPLVTMILGSALIATGRTIYKTSRGSHRREQQPSLAGVTTSPQQL